MFWVKAVLFLALAGGLVWLLGPRERAQLGTIDVALSDDPDAWLASPDPDIRPGAEPTILWADEVGVQTALSIVNLHGFSASPLEIAPVPQNIATALGANLYMPLLTGHGRDGNAMAEATTDDWWRDTAQAIMIGTKLGQHVVLIGTSTGATLAAEAARDPVLGPKIAGIVMISPNFRIKAAGSPLLTWPFARQFVPLFAGKERCFEVINDRHAQAWTKCYPTVATLPVAALVAHASEGNYQSATRPVLVLTSVDDKVVDPAATRRVMKSWAGPVKWQIVEPKPGDDPSHHVITGDILSPGTTKAVTDMITAWVETLSESPRD